MCANNRSFGFFNRRGGTFITSWSSLRNCRSTESHVLKKKSLERVHIKMNK